MKLIRTSFFLADPPSPAGQAILSSSISNKFSSSSQQQPSQAMPSSSYGSSFNEKINIIGNQIQIIVESEPGDQNVSDPIDSGADCSSAAFINSKFSLRFSETDLREFKSNIDSSRHLSDNWLAYWENEIRTNDKSSEFDLKHISLVSLVGHSSGVKSLLALDNESSIISASKDKTVKLWSLRNHGGCSAGLVGSRKNQQTCQWTYNQHKKSVFSLLFIDGLRVCASCDGSVHIWNPFVGRKLYQFESQVVTCMANLASPSTSFVVGTYENTLKYKKSIF